MKNSFARRSFILTLALLLAFTVAARAESHRATTLGHPGTRFAAPLRTSEDLRARFRDYELRPDFAEILHQWGWRGNLDDFFAAGLTNEITEWQVPVGATMPFMSSRDDGKPVCLRNVQWAGQEPIFAYAFVFDSGGERYRCVVPKPCSNFFLEDLGPSPRSGLAIVCSVPEKIISGRKMEVCLTVRNTGNIVEPKAVVTLQVPSNSVVTATTDGGIVTNNSVQWEISGLTPDSTKEVCTMLKTISPGTLPFNSSVSSENVLPVESSCQTAVVGVPAILLEKADNPDPVSIGDTTTYSVRVTNQGTADDSNVQVVVIIAPELAPVSTSEGTIDGQTVTFPALPTLAAKQAVTYKIVAKGVSAGDGHTKFTLSSDILSSPIFAEESTTVY
jgi:uncharacterized repeat protein (TIGR01451 family)